MSGHQLLIVFALCICSRICLVAGSGRLGDASAAEASVSSFSDLEQAVGAAEETRIISVATLEILFVHQLEVRTKRTIGSAMQVTLAGGNSTRLSSFFTAGWVTHQPSSLS